MVPKHDHPGDDGSTGLLGEGRVNKHHPRIETLGSIDEASAALGLARALTQTPHSAAILKDIQRDLYAIMAEVAATPENVDRFRSLDTARLEWLESQVQALASRVSIPNEFILSGDSLPAAAISMARTIVRRAERRVVELADQGGIDNQVMIAYLNRLSLFCFYLELEEIQSDENKLEISLAKKN